VRPSASRSIARGLALDTTGIAISLIAPDSGFSRYSRWVNIPVMSTLPSGSTTTSCGRSCATGIMYSRTSARREAGTGMSVTSPAPRLFASQAAVAFASRSAAITGKEVVAPA